MIRDLQAALELQAPPSPPQWVWKLSWGRLLVHHHLAKFWRSCEAFWLAKGDVAAALPCSVHAERHEAEIASRLGRHS